MARSFSGTGQALYLNTGVIAAAPFTMSCWGYPRDLTSDHVAVSIGDKDATDSHWAGYFVGGIDDTARMLFRPNEGIAWAVSDTYIVDTWQHLCCVEIASNNRKVYRNAANEGSNANTGTMNTPDQIAIGRDVVSGGWNYMYGYIAEVAIWNVALDLNSEIAALAAGYSPRLIRPQSRVFHAELIRDEDVDLISGSALTVVGSPTIVAHPRMIYPAPPFISFPAAAAPAFIPYPRPRGLRAGMGELVGGMH